MLAAPSTKSSGFSARSISEYRELLKQKRFIYVENEDPDFDWIEFSRSVTGEDLILQYGKEIFQVQLKPEFMRFSDARGAKHVLPHAEASDYPNPPKYLALFCQKPADCGGGMTTLGYVTEFLKTLTDAEQQKLTETQYYFGATGGVHANRTQGATHPILTFVEDKPVIRFSYNYIKYGDYSPDPDNIQPFTPDAFLEDIADRFLAYYEQHHLAIPMKQYSVLLWDNQCMLHARTTYNDPTRKLERIFLG